MAIVTYPLNNINYSAEDAELFHCTRTSGVFAADEDFNASVTGTNNTVTIGQGIAWIRNSRFSGKVVANKSSFSVNMGLADGTYNRIDAIVLQFSASSNLTSFVVKQGTAATSPTAPPVTQTESLYELHLYHVYRRAGATSILSGDITDLRANRKYCGVMADDVTMLGDDFVNKDMIGVANGVASLNSSGKVPTAQLPSMNYIPTSQKGAANGVASLDGNKKIHVTQLPNVYSDVGDLSVTSTNSYTTVTRNRSKWFRYGNVVLLEFDFTSICTNTIYWGFFGVSGYPQTSNRMSYIGTGGICSIEFDGGQHDGVIRPTDYFNKKTSVDFKLLYGGELSSNVDIDVKGTIMYLQ